LLVSSFGLIAKARDGSGLQIIGMGKFLTAYNSGRNATSTQHPYRKRWVQFKKYLYYSFSPKRLM